MVIYPLDTLKTRMQAPAGFLRSGGYNGLFRGVFPTVLGAAPGGAVFFGAYEWVKSHARASAAQEHWPHDAFAASCAATASCLVRNPTAIIAQRMQVGQFASSRQAALELYASGGWRAFSVGLTASAARELPFSFIQFPVYEALRRMVAAAREDREPPPPQAALCGAVAGATAAALTTPLDVVKTHQMIGHGSSEGAFATMRQILRNDGAGALFRGLLPGVGWMTMRGKSRSPISPVPTHAPPPPPPPTVSLLLVEALFSLVSTCVAALLGVCARVDAEDHLERAAEAEGGSAARPRLVAPMGPATAPTMAPTMARTRTATPAESPALQLVEAPLTPLLSGALAGVMTDGVLYPIDALKTRAISNMPRPARPSALFAGINVALLPAVPASACFFLTYERMKSVSADANLEPRTSWFLAAAVAETLTCTVRVPFEQLKIQLQARRTESALRELLRRYEGGKLLSLYRGLGATLLLDLPFALIQFPLFEAMRSRFAQRHVAGDGSAPSPTALDGAMAGSLAGGLAACATTPLDVTSITPHFPALFVSPDVSSQFDAQDATRLAAAHTDATAAELAWQLVAHHHRSYRQLRRLLGLLAGVLPRTVYMSLGGIIYLGSYSLFNSMLGARLGFKKDRGS